VTFIRKAADEIKITFFKFFIAKKITEASRSRTEDDITEIKKITGVADRERRMKLRKLRR
jgi:hypothetical protein